MKSLFGIPMNSIMIVMLVLLGLCLVSTAFVAWRRPVIFKLGVRNIPRRKAQTTLIVVGLMLATLIISAALGTGDTLNYSVNNAAVKTLGPVDEMVVYSSTGDGEGSIGSAFARTIPESSVDTVRASTDPGGNVDAVGGVLFSVAPVINAGTNDVTGVTTFGELQGVAVGTNPNVYVSGMRQETIDQLGGIEDEQGNKVDVNSLGEDGIYVNQAAASELNISTGDNVVYVVRNQMQTATVRGILPDSVLTGSINGGDPGMLMEMGRLQQITGQEGQITFVGVSNNGGDRSGLKHTDAVVNELKPTLADANLGVIPIKQDQVDAAELIANIFVTFFVVFGLFSIGVGILLIVLIFTMLAAERRAEMGMERAVGAQRRQLIQQFIAEGAGYALLSGLVGTALGVGAAFVIAQGFKGFAGDTFDITPYVAPRSLVIAYCLGVVITFLAVAISSWRVSRLNVVAAIRDIPDAYDAKRNRKQLIWSLVMTFGGILLSIWGQQIGYQAPFMIGMTLVPFGVAALLAYFGISSRLVMTLAGLYTLALWLLPNDLYKTLFGELKGDIDMFFVSGVCIVAASTLVIVQNLDTILSLAERIGGLSRNRLAAIRLAVSYPGANKSRTGLTIAMFSLIVFSLVMVAAINENFAAAFLNDEANAGWEVKVDFSKENQIDDFTGSLQADGFDMNQVGAVGRVDLPNEGANQVLAQATAADGGEWIDYPVSIGDNAYLDTTTLAFQSRANGYDSDAEIIEALKTQPDVIVVDSFSAEDASAGFGPPTAKLSGVMSKGSFDAPMVSIRTGEGQPHDVKVIGVIDSKYSTLFGAYSGQPTGNSVFPNVGAHPVSYFVSVADGANGKDVADGIELALLQYGATSTDLKQQMIDNQSTQQSFMYILQGFMGLGLIVGVAAVGVIAFRAVVERRQQIGMLRAMGFQRSMVSQAFVLESAIVVVLGVLAGAFFGLILSWQLMTSEDFTDGASSSSGFIIPWLTIVITLSAAVIAALFMSWLPARQAARVMPAEALRYE